MPIIDTLKLRNDLIGGGMPEQQAEAIAVAFGQADTMELATKSDIADLRAEFSRLEARLMRWMIAGAALGGLVGGFIGSLAR